MSGLRILKAGNRGPFTLDGTRTHVVGEREVAVIDPGPSSPAHLDALATVLSDARDVRVLLTHGHADHAGGAPRLARSVGAQILGPSLTSSTPLPDGAVVPTDAGPLTAVLTPGHTRDHLCFWWPERRALFAGDLLLGEGDTTWVAEYPTCVSDYLASLDRVDRLEPAIIFPAHGPPLSSPARDVERFRAHRLARIHQVRDALEGAPDATSGELLDMVYEGLPSEMRPAAEASLAAILQHLRGHA